MGPRIVAVYAYLLTRTADTVEIFQNIYRLNSKFHLRNLLYFPRVCFAT